MTKEQHLEGIVKKQYPRDEKLIPLWIETEVSHINSWLGLLGVDKKAFWQHLADTEEERTGK